MGQKAFFDLFQEWALHTETLSDPADRSLSKEGLFRLRAFVRIKESRTKG